MASERLVDERYALEAPIARGGSGVVWRARDTLLDRPVAIKEVELPAAITDEERERLRKRVLREARAAARLSHPGAVTLFDVVREAGHTYIVMELVEARSLAELVRDQGPLDPRRAADVGRRVLEALDTAHRRGIVHRDVKPGNVMVFPDGRTKLADFGIASLTGDPELTASGMVLGSPSYMAPEQANGESSGPAADLWALGATLYYAVEGEAPFSKGAVIATLAAVVHEQARPMRRAGPLAPVISALLRKDPDDRPPASEVRELLDAVADGVGGRPRPQSLFGPLTRVPWRRQRDQSSPPLPPPIPPADGDPTPLDFALPLRTPEPRPEAPPPPKPPAERAEEEAPAPEPATEVPEQAATQAPEPAETAAPGSAEEAAPEPAGTPAQEATRAAASEPTGGPASGRDRTPAPEPEGDERTPRPAEAKEPGGQVPGVAPERQPDPEPEREPEPEPQAEQKPEPEPQAQAGRAERSGGPENGERDELAAWLQRHAGTEAVTDEGPQVDGGPWAAATWRTPPRRALTLAALGVLAALVILVAVMLASNLGDPPGQPAGSGRSTSAAGATARTPAKTTTPTTTGSASGPGGGQEGPGGGSGSGTATDPPAGWETYTSPEAGYVLAHPPGWQVVRRSATLTDFRQPGTGTYLRVDWTDHPKPSALGAWQDAEGGFAARKHDYRRIRLEPTDYRGLDAAIWEYRYEQDGTRLHAVNLNWVASDRRAYALNFQTDEANWRASLPIFDQVQRSFRFRP